MSEPNSKLNRLQALQLAMLKECLRLCEKHRLRYYLLGGSALGAVRHSGFIPWDDDIDIGMPRPDYDTFVAAAKTELRGGLFLQTRETDPLYPQPYAKVRDPSTTFIESSVAHLDMNHGVYLDVFPLDGCAASTALQRWEFLIVTAYNGWIFRRLGITALAKASHRMMAACDSLVPLRLLRDGLDRRMKKRAYDRSAFVVNWSGAWGRREIVGKNVFGSGRIALFEGLSVSIPGDSDAYLRSLYGDYMTPPPIEKRKSHHSTDLIDLDVAYSAHTKKTGK